MYFVIGQLPNADQIAARIFILKTTLDKALQESTLLDKRLTKPKEGKSSSGCSFQQCVRTEREQVQGLLGEREVNTPEASSMVFRRAVSLATLWLSRLRRS